MFDRRDDMSDGSVSGRCLGCASRVTTLPGESCPRCGREDPFTRTDEEKAEVFRAYAAQAERKRKRSTWMFIGMFLVYWLLRIALKAAQG